jgi:glycosyltransferase involved in cell wall biosynthesis
MDRRMTSGAGLVFINGRFLGRPITGVERFGRMILRELDGLRASTSEPGAWVVLAPRGIAPPPELRAIGFRNVGRLAGHAWEQIELFGASRRGVLVNLCNSGPVLHSRQLTVLHDAMVYRYPESFSPLYGAVHRALGRALSRRSRIATVTDFSRRELSQYLALRASEIDVIPNAVSDAAAAQLDHSILDRLGVRGQKFFLSVGTLKPTKNLPAAIAAFQRMHDPDVKFVVVGDVGRAFADPGIGKARQSIILAGRLTDGEIDTLYRNALALVFPSIYEGFGIPPLEAMARGCLVLAGNIEAVNEVCGKAAIYFDPRNVDEMAAVMARVVSGLVDKQLLQQEGYERVAKYSWARSAQSLFAAVTELSHDANVN